MAAPTLESVATDFEDTGTSTYTADMPGSIAEGELLLAFVMVRGGSSNTINTPSGWTLVESEYSHENIAAALFSKVAGASEGATQDFTTSTGNDRWASAICRISGHDGVDVSGSATQASGTSTTHTAPTVTTTVDDTLLIRAVMQDLGDTNGGSPYSSPGGYTEQWDFTSENGFGTSTAGASATQASAGATGTADFTSQTDAESATFTVAIAPAAGGGGGTNPWSTRRRGAVLGRNLGRIAT